MSKLSKLQKRRRLLEAAQKIWKVLGSQNYVISDFTKTDFTPQDTKKLMDARDLCIKMARKLR